MKVQIRQSVFEPNSSSTHAISIIKKSNITEYPDAVRFDKGDFGWNFEIYFDTSDKASYLWEAIIGYYWKNIDKVKECMQAIKETLAKYGIKAVFVYDDISMHTYTYDNGDTDTYIVCKNADGEKDDGYIDHTEDLGDFIESTVFNEKRLLNYLFDYNSYVSTGNDNSDEEVETPDFGSSWDFDKGN